MNALDLALVVIVAIGSFLGYYRGPVRELFGILAWIGGGLGAALYSRPLAPSVAEVTKLPLAIGEALGGLGIFLGVYIVCRMLGWGLARLMDRLLPKSVHRVGGVSLAAVRTVLMCTVLLLMFSSRRGMPDVSERIPDSLIGSRLVSYGWKSVDAVREKLGLSEDGPDEEMKRPAPTGTSAGFLSK